MLPVVVEMHFSPGFTRQTGHATVHAFCGRLRTLRSVSLLALAIVLSLDAIADPQPSSLDVAVKATKFGRSFRQLR